MDLDERIQKALSRKKEDIIHEAELDTIQVVENYEPLMSICDLVDAEIKMKPQRREYAKEDALYARKSVCYMLKEAAKNLPEGYKFVIFDAFRPIEYQEMRFNKVLSEIMQKNPGMNYEEARKETFIYVFPPSRDPKRPPAHSTGGAIDIAIKNERGEMLDFGCAYGDFNNPAVHTNVCETLTGEQKSNRKFLIESLVKAGFSSYPGEWWHFMYGDREWAAYEEKPNAVYGRADEKMIERVGTKSLIKDA
jgi:D-alanyl-D-alanine dipeptidase